ncbi:MAG TPA: FKBP-type peptidyl-prolyl cis-trans isomerase [Ferruginibacter sp.]|nr:FKBP-type peptidyl-prolyl cis-trans isomerase [Ferruginibacter sp.]
MKKVLLGSIVVLALSSTVMAQNDAKAKAKPGAAKAPAKTAVKAPAVQFKNLLDSFSYAAGFNVATNMQAQNILSLNTAMMQKGLEDVFKKNTPQLSQEVINSVMQRQLEMFTAEKNKAAKAKGEAFLEANKKRKEVTTTASGVQYEVIKSGDANGPTPKTVDTVVVNYIVSLFDGEEIENSFKSGQPAIFPVMGVIKGWIEILQLMKPGDHWKVYVPSDLAYGMAGNGPSIPPFSTLKFEMQLVEIRPFVAKTP